LILWLGKNQPRDLVHAHRAFEELEVGVVVIIGDVPSWRVDNMPYGGVKKRRFGQGRGPLRDEDMTEIRLMVYASLDHAAADKRPR
jgi:acyl-CoA reductase-like NAD-dependent aldehyde dehydrogenase